MIELPSEETRLRNYVRLYRERFGEEPEQLSEGRALAACPSCHKTPGHAFRCPQA